MDYSYPYMSLDINNTITYEQLFDYLQILTRGYFALDDICKSLTHPISSCLNPYYTHLWRISNDYHICTTIIIIVIIIIRAQADLQAKVRKVSLLNGRLNQTQSRTGVHLESNYHLVTVLQTETDWGKGTTSRRAWVCAGGERNRGHDDSTDCELLTAFSCSPSTKV